LKIVMFFSTNFAHLRQCKGPEGWFTEHDAIPQKTC
jgi:hypothetical protein